MIFEDEFCSKNRKKEYAEIKYKVFKSEINLSVALPENLRLTWNTLPLEVDF